MTTQHTIPDPPPITDEMTTMAHGASSWDFVGHKVITSYDVPDSDRCESLLLLDNGRVLQISCDPVTHADDGTRLPPEQWGDRWEVVLYDATDTKAGEAMKDLEPGQWL